MKKKVDPFIIDFLRGKREERELSFFMNEDYYCPSSEVSALTGLTREDDAVGGIVAGSRLPHYTEERRTDILL